MRKKKRTHIGTSHTWSRNIWDSRLSNKAYVSVNLSWFSFIWFQDEYIWAMSVNRENKVIWKKKKTDDIHTMNEKKVASRNDLRNYTRKVVAKYHLQMFFFLVEHTFELLLLFHIFQLIVSSKSTDDSILVMVYFWICNFFRLFFLLQIFLYFDICNKQSMYHNLKINIFCFFVSYIPHLRFVWFAIQWKFTLIFFLIFPSFRVYVEMVKCKKLHIRFKSIEKVKETNQRFKTENKM